MAAMYYVFCMAKRVKDWK